MDCKTAKRIDIVDFLQKWRHTASKISPSEAWYRSPLREENDPSFHVNRFKNVWYDHGSGKGGDIIDLVSIFWGCSKGTALQLLSDETGYRYRITNNPVKNYRPIKNDVEESWIAKSIRLLNHTGLLSYLEDRKINIEVAKKYCNTVYYTSKQRISRDYPDLFAVGFKNNSGGWELSRYKDAKKEMSLKNCISPKDITTIEIAGAERVVIFEGFIDFLSCLTHKKQTSFERSSAIILNSTAMVNRAIKAAEKYNEVILFLDNDTAGKEAAQKFIKANSKSVNYSQLYFPNFKDYNDYLISLKTS